MQQWIFLRGLVRESGHWGAFVQEFERGQTPVQVRCIDIAGNGERCAEASPSSIAAMVEDCRHQLRLKGVVSPYHVLSISMGGMVAVQWATMYPEEIQALVVINSSMRPFNPFYERLRPQSYLQIVSLFAKRASALQWEQTIMKLTAQRVHPQALGHWLALRQRNPVRTINAWRQLWAALRFRGSASRCMPPMLILSSAADQLVAPRCSEEISKHFCAELRVHPWAGHDLPLDDGPWVMTQIANWLGKN